MAPEGHSDSALLLDAALENIPYGFCVWSSEFRLVMWNRHYLDIYSFPPDKIFKGMPIEDVVKLSAELGNHPGQTPQQFLTAYKKELRNNRGGARAKSRELLAGGRTIETAHVYSPGLGWVVTHDDVTEEIASTEIIQKRKHELERQNIRLDAAVNNISQGLCMFDPRRRLVICNAPYARIYDLPEELVKPGTPLDDILAHLFDTGMHSSSFSTREQYIKWRNETIDRGEFGKTVLEFGNRIILMQHHPMKDGGFVSTHEDITEQRQQEARIQHLARHDALTELANRIQFLEEMAASEAQIERGEKTAVLCIDLDHFKSVNDTYGHAIGDKLLKQASARLWGTTRETDILARLGGDEFSLLLRPIDKPSDAAAIAERIGKTMSAPFTIDGQQIAIGASVGIAVAPQDGETTDVLMKNADMALYRAKSEGRSTYHFFEKDMDAAIQKRRMIEAGLRAALANNELRVVFQPLVGLKETASPASKRCCVGRTWGRRSHRPSSSRSPKIPASSCRLASGCCAKPARRRRTGRRRRASRSTSRRCSSRTSGCLRPCTASWRPPACRRPGSSSRSPNRSCSTTTSRRCRPCTGCAPSASASRWTISAPAIRR